MNYFSIGNRVFAYKLTPGELLVYSFLCSVKNQLCYAVCKLGAISRCTGLSPRTVCRAINHLEAVGLISKRSRYRYDGQRAANGYQVNAAGGGKFKIDRDSFRRIGDAGSFAVYLYLMKCANNRTREAFPSLHKISGQLRICKNTVIRKIRELEACGVITKAHQHKNDGSFASNRHVLHPMKGVGVYVLPETRHKKRKKPPARSFFQTLKSFACTALSKIGSNKDRSCFEFSGFAERMQGVCKRVYKMFTLQLQKLERG